MDKDLAGQVNNETRGSLVNKQNEEALEISSTGYGYETVPKKNLNKKTRENR